jgi:hypothetical protein
MGDIFRRNTGGQNIKPDFSGRTIRLIGHMHYEDIEKTILELNPHAQRKKIDPQPGNLFRHFPSMLEEEFAILSDLGTADARKLLSELDEIGYIRKVPTQKGFLYKISRA